MKKRCLYCTYEKWGCGERCCVEEINEDYDVAKFCNKCCNLSEVAQISYCN